MESLEALKQISIIIAMCVAIYGIDSWRREHIGKRQIELAEDTLALFYEAEDAIKHLRHPVAYSHESQVVIRGDHEPEEKYNARKNAYVVFYRYNSYQELFNKIHASRYRFMAQIGKKEARPFDDLRLIVNEIKQSAKVLSRLWAREKFVTNDKWKEHLEKVNKYEAIFWDELEENDPINCKVYKVIEDIETTCKSIIAGKGTLFSLINKRIGKDS